MYSSSAAFAEDCSRLIGCALGVGDGTAAAPARVESDLSEVASPCGVPQACRHIIQQDNGGVCCEVRMLLSLLVPLPRLPSSSAVCNINVAHHVC